MHFRDCALSVVDFFVHDVGSSAIHIDCGECQHSRDIWTQGILADWVHGHSQVLDCPVLAKDLADVIFFDVPCQSLYYDLR